MRVLMVHAAYRQPGGEDVSVAEEAAALRAAGVGVERLTFTNAGPGVAAGALWNRAAGRAVAAVLDDALGDALAGALDGGGFDLLHLQNPFPAASPAVVTAATRAGVPVVMSLRNARFRCPAATLWRDGRACTACGASPWPGPWPGIARGCWRGSRPATALAAAAHRLPGLGWGRVAGFLAPSAFLRQALAPVIDPARVRVVPNLLHAPVHPRPMAERAGVLFAGRPVPEKGLAVLQAAAERAGLPLRVVEGADHAATLAAMAAARVVCVPSLWPEPFGRVALEGLAAGAAVVASATGGLPEVVGEAGLLVPPGAVSALAAALREAHDHAPVWGARARARYDRCFADGAARLAAAYADVLAVANR